MTGHNVVNNTSQNRYEIDLGDGDVAVAAYRLSGDTITFTHTEVPPQHEGEGVGSDLAQFALDDALAHDYRIDPQCSFIHAYIDEHPKYRAASVQHGG